MKLTTVTAIALAAAALASCGKKDEAARAPDAASAGKQANATAPLSLTPPARRPGLWEQTISTAGRSQTTSICFDEAMDKQMAVWGQASSQERCEGAEIKPKLGGGWTFSSTCNLGTSGKIVSQGETSGDFKTAYKVTFNSVTTGAAMAQMNGATSGEVSAVWKGACPADMKAGDMVLPGGMKMNILALKAQSEAMKNRAEAMKK